MYSYKVEAYCGMANEGSTDEEREVAAAPGDMVS